MRWLVLAGRGGSQRVGPSAGVPTATRALAATAVVHVSVVEKGVEPAACRPTGATGSAEVGAGGVVVVAGAVVVAGVAVVPVVEEGGVTGEARRPPPPWSRNASSTPSPSSPPRTSRISG